MKQYFSWDSTIFSIISIILIILGSSVFLLIWLILSTIFIVVKAGLNKEQSSSVWSWLIYGGIFGSILFGFFGFSVILIGFWFYILYQVYLA